MDKVYVKLGDEVVAMVTQEYLESVVKKLEERIKYLEDSLSINSSKS